MIRWKLPQEHIGLVTIDRPDRRNALNAELCDELRSHLEAARGLRAVVITGGGVAFCAGADIIRRAQDTGGLEHGGSDTFRPAFERMLDAIVELPGPVIAAVNGGALGAGMQLAVACDLRVVVPPRRSASPRRSSACCSSAPNIQRLAVLVGQGAARDLLMTGRTITVDEAREMGPATGGGRRPRRPRSDVASELAALAPLSVQGHKRALNLVAQSSALDDGAIAEIRAARGSRVRERDLQEGLAAFGEKRRRVPGRVARTTSVPLAQ